MHPLGIIFFVFGGIMNRLQAALILFAILFVFLFIGDYFFIKRRYLKRIKGKGKKRKKNNELTEVTYLTSKFNLDKNKLNLNKLLIVISIINAFIISLVSVVVMLIRINVILQLIIGFVLLISLIYALYELLGRFLVMKG